MATIVKHEVVVEQTNIQQQATMGKTWEWQQKRQMESQGMREVEEADGESTGATGRTLWWWQMRQRVTD